MSSRYAIGVDLGTASARALLVDLVSGDELATACADYPSGVLDSVLPSTGQQLPPTWALQDPQDWLDTLQSTVAEVLVRAQVPPEQVVGIGIAATCCTVLPTKATGEALAADVRWSADPHAWPKLWKHHAAQPQADRLTLAAQETGTGMLDAYGGRYSSEWVLPKALQMLEESPEAFTAAERLVEAADWVVWQLVGREVRGAQMAGYKAGLRIEHSEDGDGAGGFPARSYLAAVHPRLPEVLEKLSWLAEHLAPGERAGGLAAPWARRLGLPPGTPVAVGNIDAQVCAAACGALDAGQMTLVMGTSVCNLLLAEHGRPVPGTGGVVLGGIASGLWAYEAGQAGVGDMLGWFVRHQLPATLERAAEEANRSPFELLEGSASVQAPGECGVVALDWWNGNRSVLMDADLSGVLVGLTLTTRPEDIYRALIDAAAFGQRRIIETFERAGVPVREVVACGGLATKSPLLMQVLADVTRREMRVSASKQTAALGAALHAAVAAGEAGGGFASISEAAAHLARLEERVYRPRPTEAAAYDELYDIYSELHDYFGRTRPQIMHDLMRRLRQRHPSSRG
ncbi:MAG: L-ribulokinase [Frankiales bacterium]|jgi:L-ribulokinase|nr:L-ribulokinase [Frankiales bacterium]